MNNFFPSAPGTYSVLRKLAGIAEGSEIASRTALECNQDFINAISFSKGCYLGQELTARSQFTGVVRKRIIPVMIVDTEMEVPKPWVMASMIQELGTEEGMDKIFGLTGEDGEKKKLALEGYIPPPLPKISAAGAGSIVSMMMGSVVSPDKNPQDVSEELNKLRVQGEKLQTEITELAQPGSSIIDKKDSRTIGKIVSFTAPGTTVLLAQMRLDRLGLLGREHKWSRTNKILIGDSDKEYRFLPFLPLWWPDIDPATGKGKVVEDWD
jgi:folate-binding protein YgfZ